MQSTLKSVCPRPVHSRAWALAVVGALLFTGLVTFTAPAAAQDVTPHRAAAASTVPTCPGIGVPANGPRMLQDEHGGAASELALQINALICSANDGATIDIKS